MLDGSLIEWPWVSEMLSSREEWISRTDINTSPEQWMWRTARELAHSGACADWREIDRKLAELGYPGASADWSGSFRLVLDRLCAAARPALQSPANDSSAPLSASA